MLRACVFARVCERGAKSVTQTAEKQAEAASIYHLPHQKERRAGGRKNRLIAGAADGGMEERCVSAMCVWS